MKNYILSGINLTFLATFVESITDWVGLALLIISAVNAMIPLVTKLINNIKVRDIAKISDDIEAIGEIVEDTIEQVSEHYNDED